MTTQTHADADQTDVSVETEIAADRIEARVDVNVKPRSWPSKEFDVIVLTWDHNTVKDVNSYSKAGIINKVYQSNAAVELYDAADGDECVVFKLATDE
jgi:hypothetical protein